MCDYYSNELAQLTFTILLLSIVLYSKCSSKCANDFMGIFRIGRNSMDWCTMMTKLENRKREREEAAAIWWYDDCNNKWEWRVERDNAVKATQIFNKNQLFSPIYRYTLTLD